MPHACNPYDWEDETDVQGQALLCDRLRLQGLNKQHGWNDLKKKANGCRGMAQWLRAFHVLANMTNTHIVAHNYLWLPVSADLTPYFDFHEHQILRERIGEMVTKYMSYESRRENLLGGNQNDGGTKRESCRKVGWIWWNTMKHICKMTKFYYYYCACIQTLKLIRKKEME